MIYTSFVSLALVVVGLGKVVGAVPCISIGRAVVTTESDTVCELSAYLEHYFDLSYTSILIRQELHPERAREYSLLSW